MSEHFSHAHNDSDGNSKKSMQSHHSDWMSHWTRRSNKESDHTSLDSPSTSGKETASNACSTSRGHNLNFNSTALSLKCYTVTPLAVSSDANLNSSKDGHFEAEGTSHNTKEHVKTYPFLGDSSFAILRPLCKDLNVSSNEMVQQGSGKVNELLSFFPSRVGRPALAPEEQLPVINTNFVDSEKMNSQRHSTFIACDDKLECHLKSVRSLTSYQQPKNASSSEIDPCKIHGHLPEASQHKFQEKHNALVRNLWNQSHHSLMAESGNLYNACSSSPKFPNSLQDLESMRICRTTLDSVVGLPDVQTSYSLKSAKGTDFDLYRLKESLINLRESAGYSRNAYLQFCSMPYLGIGRQGVKIESLSSSSDSDGKVNVGDHSVKSNDSDSGRPFDDSAICKGKQVMDDLDQKNESSAETDTMDLDDRGKKRLGVNSSGASELLKLGLGTPQFSISSTSKYQQKDRKLSVKKTQFPGLPAANSGDASSSRTQSLNNETFFSHSRSDQCPGGSAMLEPGSRWIKRLRLSASEPYSFGTKHSTKELSSRDKGSPRKSLKSLLSRSEPTINEFHGKELVVLDKTTGLARCSDSSSVDKTQKEGRLALTSQSWIRRWFQNQSANQQKKPGGVVNCEPQRSKLPFEGLQKRQLPSVSAMALMGKAMRGFQPCDLQKKGPVIVWNTRNF